MVATVFGAGFATAPAVAAPPEGAGWIALFDGRNLDRWRLLDEDRAHWKIVDGVLDCDALARRALWTKQSFRDVEMQLQWRFKTAKELYGSETEPDGTPIPNQPNSGVLLRGTAQAEVNVWAHPVGSGQVWAYHRGEQSKSLSEAQRARYCPPQPADLPIGQWNTMHIKLVGEQLSVWVNGRLVIDDVTLRGIPRRGTIALQQHGGIDPKTGRYHGASSTIQFREVYVRPLGTAQQEPPATAPPQKPSAGRPAGAAASGVPDRPNVLFLLADDLGWMDAGFMGSRYYQTPNLDRLAADGMVFTSAYANAPNCLPSRACMLTGQYTPRHGQYNIAGPGCQTPAYLKMLEHARLKPIPNSPGWPEGTVSLPSALGKAGYRTGMIGKWHHGQSEKQSGFEYTASFSSGIKRGDGPAAAQAAEDDPKLIFKMTELAEQFIRRPDPRPFYLHLAYHAVHIPVEARRETVEQYRHRPAEGGRCHPDYAAMIEHLDQGVGRLLECIDQQGLCEKTVVIFFSDNGGEQRCTSNVPLRGYKQEVYEGGIRVPMIVRWPGRVPPGSKCDEPVTGVDFYPTLLELAGAGPPQGHPLDGMSLLPLFSPEGSLGRKALFWHIPSYWHKCLPCCAMRAGRYKLIEFFDDPHLELYDLQTDLGESRNLAKSKPQLAKQLHDQMLAWRRGIDAPVPTEPNPLYVPQADNRKTTPEEKANR